MSQLHCHSIGLVVARSLLFGGCALIAPATLAAEVSQIAQGTAVIRSIEVNPTDTGLEIQLETPDSPQTFETTYGETLVIDIINTQLPEGATLFQENPAPGIASVEVVQQYTNTVRVKIVGETELPTAEITSSEEGLAVTATTGETLADEPAPPDEPQETEPAVSPEIEVEEDAIELIVTATRTEEPLNRIPRSVTVIDREDLDTQTSLSPTSLTELLGREVPGFGVASPAQDDRGSLRGRSISYLIDGIPVSDVFARPQRQISLDAIERIEVVRGPNAVFGANATGGTVNIIPRRPGEGESRLAIELGTTAAASGGGAFFNSEGFAFFSRLELAKGLGDFDYILSTSLEREGSLFDAEGDRIFFARPRDEDRTLNVLGQLGFDLDEEQRLQLTVNHYDIRRVDNEFIADVEGSDEAGKAQGIEVGDQEFIDTPPFFDRNTIVSLRYNHDNLFGSSVSAQGYYRNYSGLTGGFFDAREFFGFISNQLLLDIEGGGGRLQVDTPLGEQANLLWGTDFDYQKRDGFIDFIDPVAFDESGGQVIRKIDSRNSLPYGVSDLGLFAQLQWDVVDNLTLSGGLRYSNFNVSVSDYISAFRGFDIKGGNISLDDVVFNVGGVYRVTNELGLFANFAQGFSLPNLNRLLFSPPEGLDIGAGNQLLEPVNVDNYEVGVRGNWNTVQFSLAGFYSNSDLSDSIRSVETEEGFLETQLVRAPQREYGIEATLDWQATDAWQLGTTLSWQEGETDSDNSGDFIPQTTYVISPLKWTAYVENQTISGWRNRLQLLAIGGRSRNFEGGGFDPRATEGFVVVDYISSIDLGDGVLSIGIENLFNTQYLVPGNQLNAAFDGFAERAPASRGRTITATYRITF